MEEEFTAGRWDYAILDEGHVIKNPQTKLSKAMHSLRTRHRLLLTGTPIQNHLQDFWAVLNWATEGRCLGSLRHFNATIAEPIHKGQDPLANQETREAAQAAMRLLLRLCRPLLLQRKKKDHLLQADAPVQLPPKKEFVVWVALSSQQREEYRRYLRSTAALSALTRTSYPVEVINTLKVLCRHPALLQISRSKAKGGQRKDQPGRRANEVDELTNDLQRLTVKANSSQGEEEEEEEEGDLPDALLDAHSLLKGSIKLRLLLQMVRQLLREDHRVLVFSQSQILLRLIQSLLAHYGIASSRIDGSTTYKERQAVIEEFNRPLVQEEEECYTGPRVCLLTTKACGFGITLTGADRVIIFDPSWNPAEDSQAVDRAYRIGQTRPVLVYRFIHTGCVEQKVYEKQVFKEGLRAVSERGDETRRYFAGQSDLKQLLALDHTDEQQSHHDASEKENTMPSMKTPSIFSKLHSDLRYLEEDHLLLPSSTTTSSTSTSTCGLHGLQGVTRHDELFLVNKKGEGEKERLVIDLTQSPLPPPPPPPAPPLASTSLNNKKIAKKMRQIEEEEEEEWLGSATSPLDCRASRSEGLLSKLTFIEHERLAAPGVSTLPQPRQSLPETVQEVVEEEEEVVVASEEEEEAEWED
eukprot:scaffold26_cov159-Ochromonas_danica.AAC.20